MIDTEQRLALVEARLEALEKRFQQPDGGSGGIRVKELSAKEFLMTKKADTENQKVLAFAYYLEHHVGVVPFNVSDLETVFSSAREKGPKNLNDAVNKNVARGYLMEAKEKKDSKKAWLLTATGEKFVEEEMGK